MILRLHIFFPLFFLCLQANHLYGQQLIHNKSLHNINSSAHFTIVPSIDSIFSEKLQKLGPRRSSSFRTANLSHYYIDLNLKEIQSLLPYIKHLDYRIGDPQVESYISNYFPEVNAISRAKKTFPQYFTEAETISLKEHEPNPADIDLLNKIQTSELSSGKKDDHATDMATIITGDGNTSESSKGILSNALISSTDFNTLLPDPTSYFKNSNISVQNHSYGLNVEDYYGIEAQAYDEQVREFTNLVHVFSAGNRGEESGAFSAYKDLSGFSNLSGTFKQAKNIITVGAVDSFSNVTASSSRGPAHDGRIKPELVAYGYSGTSDAAAIVSGCVAVAQQALRLEGQVPSASLVKAVLIAGAEDIGEEGPDFMSGFGKVNLYNTLSIINRSSYQEIELIDGDQAEIQIEVTEVPMRLAIVWTDPPAEVDNNRALINDIDLYAEGANGDIVYPYLVRYTPSQIEMGVETGRGRDSINNVELLEIEVPGSYTIHVEGTSIVTDEQVVSLAYHTPEAPSFIFPHEGAKLQPFITYPVLISGSPENVILEFDAPSNYELFSPLIYDEEYPDLKGSVVSTEGELEETDFSVIYEPTLRVAWTCEDSTTLVWDDPTSADYYHIFKLSDDGMEVIDSSVSRSYTISNSEHGFYAVRKVLEGGSTGSRSIAVNSASSNLPCLLSIFSGAQFGDSLIISVELVSDIRYDEIRLEKLIGGKWSTISDVPNTGERQLILDPDPFKGSNYFRLSFFTGIDQIFSDEVEVLFIPEDEILIRPTLTTPELGIDLIQGTFRNLEVALFDTMGRLMYRDQILSSFEFITFEGIPSGLYYYVLSEKDTIVASGKIIIHPE